MFFYLNHKNKEGKEGKMAIIERMSKSIEDLYDTVTSEFRTLKTRTSELITCGPEEKQKKRQDIIFSTQRVSGILVASLGAVCTFAALPILASPSGVITLAFGVALMVYGYDIFKLAKNTDEYSKSLKQAVNVDWNYFWYAPQDAAKETNIAAIKAMTKDTLLEPLWTYLMMKSRKA
jgi:hypothetical protein